jgi:hypothetical protein
MGTANNLSLCHIWFNFFGINRSIIFIREENIPGNEEIDEKNSEAW